MVVADDRDDRIRKINGRQNVSADRSVHGSGKHHGNSVGTDLVVHLHVIAEVFGAELASQILGAWVEVDDGFEFT